ncbi:MAG: Gfo/Idh/MocA family protein [Bacillus sp. (in: firmicutes)]
MNPIKIGVAGIGSMGANHCKALYGMKNIAFIGIYDVNQKKREEAAKKFGVSAFSSYDELLEAVDAVILAVPTSYHFLLTTQAIQKGKHVLIEKPFVTSLKEAEQLTKMVDNESVIVQVGHVERFNPAYKELAEIINQNDVVSLEARRFGVPNRHMDTDVIFDIMIHDIDLILQLVDSPLSTVSGVGYYIEEGKQLEAASALLSFQNGCFATLLSSRFSLEKKRSLYVTEKHRFLKTNLLTKEIYIYNKVNHPSESVRSYRSENIIEKIAVSHEDALCLEIDHFLQSIQSQQTPKVSVHGATKVLEVALKIKEQIEKNKGTG